jgi:metal-responsive CopG/Arc/MetJ family transcriptional regulator
VAEAEAEEKKVKRISIDLPIELIEGVDRLRKEWGLRSRGLVFARLLEVILSNDLEEDLTNNQQLELNQSAKNDLVTNNHDEIDNKTEEKAIVIVGDKNIEIKNVSVLENDLENNNKNKKRSDNIWH